MIGDRYGLHRVMDPPGAMPQNAWRIDNTPVCYSNEILIDVETLNIDSASFAQIREQAGGDPKQMADIMVKTVAARGKHHNPVIGSGGMLIGRVQEIGTDLQGKVDLSVGERIATLVSLSLTPLTIDEIVQIDHRNPQVKVKGKGILFESGLFAKLPSDIPDSIALAIFDVCGAPALTRRWVREGQRVVILGAGGKSGLLVLRQACLSVGKQGQVVAIERGEEACEALRKLAWAHQVLNLDATNGVAVYQEVERATEGQLADVTINCVNVPGTEMATILATRDEGIACFFSMATSFTTAALCAEGVGKDITLLIGNGYVKGHVEKVLSLIRECPELLAIFSKRYA